MCNYPFGVLAFSWSSSIRKGDYKKTTAERFRIVDGEKQVVMKSGYWQKSSLSDSIAFQKSIGINGLQPVSVHNPKIRFDKRPINDYSNTPEQFLQKLKTSKELPAWQNGLYVDSWNGNIWTANKGTMDDF